VLTLQLAVGDDLAEAVHDRPAATHYPVPLEKEKTK
jgi:hypothetical protein